MAIYKVKVTSRRNAGIVLVILLVLFLSNAKWIFTSEKVQAIKYIIILMYGVFSWVMWQLFATGRTEWTIDDKVIIIRWTKKFPFSQFESINIIEWSEIAKINKATTRSFTGLEFFFSNGMNVKYYHDPMVIGDDYKKMIAALKTQMNQRGLQVDSLNAFI
jgi:hypothetical protein